MVFFLECVVACVLFTAALEALAAKRAYKSPVTSASSAHTAI